MRTAPASLVLTWDGADVESVAAGRRWILTAMSSHGPALVTMLWRMLGEEADVCDAYQETFLNLTARTDGREPGNVKAFLSRAAANAAVSMLRRRKVHRHACEAVSARREAPPPADAGADLDAARLQDALRANIARLPDLLREVVVLKDLAELPYDQVARFLGISRGAARVYRHRAVRLLASWMRRLEET